MLLHDHATQQLIFLRTKIKDILFPVLLSTKIAIDFKILLCKIEDSFFSPVLLKHLTVSFGILIVVEVIDFILNPGRFHFLTL
ncbi:hypothetical protein D3C71_1623710 [compost metagenome]